MKKIDKFLDELQGLKKKGYDKKKIDALTEGVNLIAAEYRRRKTKADARKKAMVEAAGFAKLDQQRKASGLPSKTFIEGVGKTIIECNQPDEVKSKLMDTLGKYAALMESADTIATRWALEKLDDADKKFLSEGNLDAFKKHVLERTNMAFRWAAEAMFDEVAEMAANKAGKLLMMEFVVKRALIDTPDEKLLIITPTDSEGQGYFAYAARVQRQDRDVNDAESNPKDTNEKSAAHVEAADTVTESGKQNVTESVAAPEASTGFTEEELAAFRAAYAALDAKRELVAKVIGDEDLAESHIDVTLELFDDIFRGLGQD